MLRTLIIAAIALHGVSLLFTRLRRKRTGTVLFFLASLLPIAHISAEWIQTGQPPLGSMYHVMVALAACAIPVYLAVVWGRGIGWISPFMPFTAATPLIAALFCRVDTAWHLAPALQSPWFVPHTIAYMLSYAMNFVAILLLLASCFRTGQEDRTRLNEGSYEVLCLAFPLMTFGLLSGALWANSIWGRYWSWDPKETWSLITWFLYLVYFHCRKHGALQKYANTAHALAFAALITTFVLVSILPKLASKLHSYV